MNNLKVAIGYARISTNETMQKYSLSAQKTDIENFCKENNYKLKKIEFETASGTKINKRPKLTKLLEEQNFDILITTKIDRLARNVLDLNKIIIKLKEKGKEVIFIENNIDTNSLNGKLFFNILGSFAEFEAGIIKERVIRGLKEAKVKGIRLGRPRSKKTIETQEIKEINRLRRNKISFNKIALSLGYSNGSVIYSKLKNYKNKAEYIYKNQRKIDKIKNSFKLRKNQGLNIGRPKNI